MKFEIKNRFNASIIFSLECKSLKICVEAAIKNRADLHGANLHEADLHEADLHGADLHGANLHGANLHGADLHEADLHGANLDFACWPFHCGSFNAKADDRLVAQLIHHIAKLNTDKCSGGVKESVEHIRNMAISDLFCEYRNDIKRIKND